MRARRDTGDQRRTGPAATRPASTARPYALPKNRVPLGQLLVEARVISEPQLEAALTEQSPSGKRLGGVLLEQGSVDERALARALSVQLDIPMANLAQVQPTPEALAALPERVARAHLAIPLSLTGDALQVAVADPSEGVISALSEVSGRTIEPLIAPRPDIELALNSAYRVLGTIQEHVDAFESTEIPPVQGDTVTHPAAEDAPVVHVVNLLITQALRDRASDIHIEPQDKILRVRFRVDGTLHDVVSLPINMAPAIVSRLKVMAGMNIVERRRAQDGQITTVVDGREIDIRVATVATIWGETCVLRLLDKSRSLLKLGQLGMSAHTHEQFAQLIEAPFGMVICAGPTGSGKTTTLYAALSEINKSDRNIMTIEDPVEYVFPSINQIQTNEQAGITFADGLKSILRQDPDVILVGEIRDAETARIAVQSALTGHLVLSSLHATDSAAALHRFLDMGIESFLIASSVVAVVGQRLVRRICTSCREPYEPSPEELAFFRESAGGSKADFVHGVGCNFCAGTGYQDRMGVYELMRITPEIKRLIVGWATQEELRRTAVAQGMTTLDRAAIDLIAEDVTTIAEVMRAIYAF